MKTASPKSSLLTALRVYRPREGLDPLENFVTEAFAWLLQNRPEFGHFYLGKICHRLQVAAPEKNSPADWKTQLFLGGVYPDLVATYAGTALLFEHKVGAELHENQIANYRRVAEQEFGSGRYRVILVTATCQQHGQEPDLAICWKDIHEYVEEWKSHRDFNGDHLFADFQALLESEGLGPPAPISHEAILAYGPAKHFEAHLSEMLRRTIRNNWGANFHGFNTRAMLPNHRMLKHGQDPWGRLGIYLLGDIDDWSPGLFAGFLLDGADHRVKWLDPRCPDFSLIFSVNINLHPRFWETEEFLRLTAALRVKVEAACPGYQLLEHFHAENPNRWHPFHIRRSMLDLFRGTKTAEEQDQRFVTEVERLVKAVTSCPEFGEFRAMLQSQRKPAGSTTA